MPFIVDLSRHVKIWFSKDRSSFMNAENQLRLVKFRHDNPDATLTLIYASTLLNDTAVGQLKSFCDRHKFRALDFSTELNIKISPSTSPTNIDRKLYEIAKTELAAVSHHNTGNLAAASDIIRLLNCVRELGIYTDCDVKVSLAKNAPTTIEVQSPLVFNISHSVIHPAHFSLLLNPLQAISLNNDMLCWGKPTNEQAASQKTVFEEALFKLKLMIVSYNEQPYKILTDNEALSPPTNGFPNREQTITMLTHATAKSKMKAHEFREKLLPPNKTFSQLFLMDYPKIKDKLSFSETEPANFNTPITALMQWWNSSPSPDEPFKKALDDAINQHQERFLEHLSPEQQLCVKKAWLRVGLQIAMPSKLMSSLFTYAYGPLAANLKGYHPNPHLVIDNPDETIKNMANANISATLAYVISQQSGPALFARLLRGLGYISETDYITTSPNTAKTEQITAMSVYRYPDLFQSLRSTQGIHLDASGEPTVTSLTPGDASFTPGGEAIIQHKEQTMHQSATLIQHAWRRYHQPASAPDTNNNDEPEPSIPSHLNLESLSNCNIS